MIMTRCWHRWVMAAQRKTYAVAWRKKPMRGRPLMMPPFPIGWRMSWILKCPPTAPLAASSTRLCAMAKTRISKPVFMPVTRPAKGSPRRGKFRARLCRTIISMTRMPPLNWSASLTLTALPAPLSNTPIRAASRLARPQPMHLPKHCAAIRCRLLAALLP